MRRLGVLGALVALFALGWPTSAAFAEPELTVSSVRQEPGLVEFYLSGEDLPVGAALTGKTVKVSVNDRDLAITTEEVSSVKTGAATKRTVLMVLDTSGSMVGEPMTAAKRAANAYLDALPADVRVGIVTAGSPSAVALSPTGDRARAKAVVAGLTATGETALYDALVAAGKLIPGSAETTRVLVLSDGADTRSSTSLASARAAVSKVPVDTIAFRTEESTAAVLTELSAANGGHAYKAGDAAALTGAFSMAAGSFSVQLLVRVTVPAELQGKDTTLAVRADLGGKVVATDLKVTLVPDTGASTPLIGEVSQGLPTWTWIALPTAVFVGLLAVTLLVLSPVFAGNQRRQRIAQIEQFTAPRRPGAPPPESDNAVIQAALQMSSEVMKQANVEGRMAQQLDRAGMRMRPHEWLLLRFAVLLGAVLLLTVAITPWYLGSLAGAVLGWGSTAMYHRIRASRRLSTFAEQLPEALQLIIGSLRSGFSLPQSIDAMTRELGDPLSTEFGRALGETRLGADIDDALERVANRMQSKDLAFAVVAIRVQREIGGNLAEVLATTVATMRERAMLYRQVRALSAEGRLSAYVLIALPIVVAGYLITVRPTYLLPLVSTLPGLVMALGGLTSLVVGTIWMLKVVKVEV